MKKISFVLSLKIKIGGEGGIRTLETREGLPALQAGALGHYATSPLPILFLLPPLSPL